MGPGATTLTVMPKGASSSAQVRAIDAGDIGVLETADLAAFGFTKVVQPSLDKASVNGTWSFTPDSPAGKGIPAVVFTPSTPDTSSLRTLLVVDGRLDDGDGAKGIFRVSETEAAFTLKAE